MGIRERVVDFLGRILSAPVGSMVSVEEDYTSCLWMEVARDTMASYVSAALQKSEVRFYKANGSRDYDNGAWLWNISPNPNQSRAELIDALVKRLYCGDGDALVVPLGKGDQTNIYLADGFFRQRVPGGKDIFTNISIEGSSSVIKEALSSDSVYYFDLTKSSGMSALLKTAERQYQAFAKSCIVAVRDHNAPKWVYNMGAAANGTPEQLKAANEELVNNLKDFVTADRAAVLPLNQGKSIARVAEGSTTHAVTSDQVVGLRKDMFDMVAECFRMPTSLLYGNTNNFSELLSSFLTFTVDPLAQALAEEITRKTFTRTQWQHGAHVVVDTTHIRHVDLFDVADQIEKLVGSSIDSPNEIREFTGQNPIPEPWADEYQRTKNHETAGGGD